MVGVLTSIPDTDIVGHSAADCVENMKNKMATKTPKRFA